MISLILPYWDRQRAANKALRLLTQTYPTLSFEVIVIDDGNREPFVPPGVDYDLRVVRLPGKDAPCCPTAAWNVGVDMAKGAYVGISAIEVLHERPVLREMRQELDRLGERGYVLAAAWCPEQDRWHTHSTVKVPDCHAGAGLAFLALMHKSFYKAIGGFSAEFRDGAGYEDRDFIHKLTAAGAQFVIRDDLVVTHPKTGAKIKWPAGAMERNRRLFTSKWLKAGA